MYSDMMLLLARTTSADQVKKRSDGLSVFLIDMSGEEHRARDWRSARSRR